MTGKIWIDGGVVDAAAARVPVFDRGFLYGDSVYEVLRTFGGRPSFLDDHLDRLAGSAARLAMTLPDRALIARATVDAVRACSEPECYVRIMVTRGSGPIGLDPALADAPRLIVLALPLAQPPEELYRDGATLAIVGARRSAPGTLDPRVKSGNYLNSVLAVAEARRKHAYEALMCDPVGRLAEGSSSNLFVVRAGRLQTPPLSVGLLEGITRRHVMAAARRLGIGADEVSLWPIDLATAEEAFITSSVRGVMPIVRVVFADRGDAGAATNGAEAEAIGDGRPGPITRRVSEAYLDAARVG
jgi:branched-chain amino acid aminotransferase